MPSIQLTQFSVTYDTNTKAFSLSAEAEAPGKLPLGGLVHDVDLQVNFTSTVNSTTKKRELSGHVEADLPVGPTVFLVTYDLSPTVKQFVGQWKSTGGVTLGINDVAKVLGITDVVSVHFRPIVSQVTMTGSMTIGGVALNMTGKYKGTNQGWELSGSGGSAKAVSVGTFLRSLSKDLGATLPPALTGAMPSIQLTQFSVTYDTNTKAFSLSAEAEAPGKLPLGGLVHDVDLQVNFTSTVNSTTKKRELSGHVEADLPVGPTVFLVTYDLSPTVKQFVGQWKSTGGVTLGINDVAKVLSCSCVR